MKQGKLLLEISNLTNEEIYQHDQESELLAEELVETFGAEFWQRYFSGEFNSLN